MGSIPKWDTLSPLPLSPIILSRTVFVDDTVVGKASFACILHHQRAEIRDKEGDRLSSGTPIAITIIRTFTRAEG